MATQFLNGSFVAQLGDADNQGSPLRFYRTRQGIGPGKTLGQLDEVLGVDGSARVATRARSQVALQSGKCSVIAQSRWNRDVRHKNGI